MHLKLWNILCIYTQSYNIHMQSYIYAQSFMCVCIYIYIYIWLFGIGGRAEGWEEENDTQCSVSKLFWEFPGSPVVRTPRFHCRDVGSMPGWGPGPPTPRGIAKKKKLLCCKSSFPGPFYRASVTIRGPVDILFFSGLSDASWHLVWLSSWGHVCYYEGRTFLCTCSSF